MQWRDLLENRRERGGFWPSATCDENGVAVFADVAPGRFGVDVSFPGKESKFIGGTPERFPGENVPWEHDTNGHQTKTIDVELFDPACATLVGVVKNGAKTVNSFRLLDGRSGKEVCKWTSYSAGFTLGSVPLGSYIFEARCGGNNAMVFPLQLTRTGYTFIDIDAAPHTLRCVSELAPGDDARDLATMRARLTPELLSPAQPATATAWINEELRFENVASGIYFVEVEFLTIQDRPVGWCSQRIKIGSERELRVSLKVDRSPPSGKQSQIRINPRFSEIAQVRDMFGEAHFLNADGFIVGHSYFRWELKEPDEPARFHVPPVPFTSVEIEEVGSYPIVFDAGDPLLRSGSVALEFQPRRGTLMLVLEADDLRPQEAYESLLETLDEDWGFKPFEGVRPVLWNGKISLLVPGFRARGQSMRLKLPGFEAYEFHVPATGPFPRVVPIKLVRMR